MSLSERLAAKAQARQMPENNNEICRLQARWEVVAWEDPSAAQALKRAVAWLRQNPESTAAEAEERFF